ncbi:hypothetical protein B0H14DRAFT_3150921 [Mycena olivaceomarginata]|nr:hypothetical protein B0H14DRAFT_3150921 [Mycena olivaceomarginata]
MHMEDVNLSAGPSKIAVAQSASRGEMFHNATGFGVHGSQFMCAGEREHTINGPVTYSPIGGPAATSVPNTPLSPAPVYSESGNYCSQLLRQGRGTPLYVPGPQVNLTAEYQKTGVAIGDVGRITSEGSYDFFFNIYLPADHRINANIPEDFVPLTPYDPVDVAHYNFNPGNYVCSPSVNAINGGFSEFPGGEFAFHCRGPGGAVLALPHGSPLEKLENLGSMRRYAAKHAESWYKYVNETRGRGLVNGNLFLVTGWEKAESWGMAFFQDVPSFQLGFRPTADAANRYRYRWHGTHCRRKHADSPGDGTPLNQTTFIHAFAISVCEGIWGKLFGSEVCQPVDSTFQERSGRGFVPYGSQGSSLFGLSFFFGSSTYGGGRQYSGRAPAPGGGDVIPGMVADASPIPKIIHPSQIIHEHILREAPQGKIVITHDDDWRDVFRDDGARPTGQASGELQRAIFDRFEITEEDGAVFLATKSHTSASMGDAAMTEEQRQDHGRITIEEPSDNLRVPENISADQDHGDSREGLLDPNFTENQPDPHDSARVSDGTVCKEQGEVGEGSQAWLASPPRLPPYRSPQASLLANDTDLPVSPILMPSA